ARKVSSVSINKRLDFLCPVSDILIITAPSVAFICDENADHAPAPPKQGAARCRSSVAVSSTLKLSKNDLPQRRPSIVRRPKKPHRAQPANCFSDEPGRLKRHRT